MEELIKELRKLSKQMDKVNEIMENIEVEHNIDINDYIVEKYPFNESFDETICLVDNWIENIEDSIKK